MLKELMQHMGTFGLAETALVIFFLCFIAICIFTLLRPRTEMDHIAHLPQDDGPTSR